MIFFIFGMTCITQSDLSGPGFPINRPTVCGTGAGAGVDSAWEQEKLEARKCSKSRTVPARPVHALLGGDSWGNFITGFSVCLSRLERKQKGNHSILFRQSP